MERNSFFCRCVGGCAITYVPGDEGAAGDGIETVVSGSFDGIAPSSEPIETIIRTRTDATVSNPRIVDSRDRKSMPCPFFLGFFIILL